MEKFEAVLTRRLSEVPLESDAWDWGPEAPTRPERRGRSCVRLAKETAAFPATLPEVQLADGVLEADVLVGRERGFPGVVWRVQDEDNFESFYVRPHQVGNPDAIQ